MNSPIQILALALLAAFLLVGPESSSAQVTTARLSGVVQAHDGSGLAGAHILARNLESGRERGGVASSVGRYQITLVEPGDYALTASFVGFAAETRTPITLQVGQVLTVDFSLEPSVDIADTLVVSVVTPVLELTESTYRTVISPAEIENIPLYSREVTELALLAPGTSRARDLTFYSPVHFGALGNRDLAVFLDGLDMSAYHLGGRLGYSQPVGLNALDQFEVLTGGFPAQYGNAGGIINMITKSGGQRLQGSGFIHYFSDKLSATNHFVDEKLEATRYQFGATVGGPVFGDRTSFFAAFERSQLDETRAVYTNGAFPDIEGTFVAPDRHSSWTLRFDHRLSPIHSFMASYTGHSSQGLTGVGGVFAEDAGAEGGAEIHYLVAGHRWLASDRFQLETKAGYLHSDGTTKTLSDEPGRWYPSAFIGSSPVAVRGNSLLREERWQLRSDATFLVPDWYGSHVLTGGAHLQYYKNRDQVEWYANGQFLFANDADPLPYLAIIGSPSDITIDASRISMWVQDDWLIHKRLTLNLGLRYDIDVGTVNEDYVSSRNDPDLPFTSDGTRATDTNNLAPRVGLAWVPFENMKTVARANYGIYYTRMVTEYAVGERIGDSSPIYYVPSPGTTDLNQIPYEFYPPGIILTLPEHLETPYSHQVSVGLSHEVMKDLAVDVQYVGIWGHNEIYREYDINPLDVTTFPPQRPLPRYGFINHTLNEGQSEYNAIHFVLRSSPVAYAQFRAFYSISWANNDFDDGFFTKTFAHGPALWDNRHRFVFQGNVTLPATFMLSGTATLESGRPYPVVTGVDNNHNGMLDDDLPPDAGRNSGRAEGVQILDARLSKLFTVSSARIEVFAEVFNLLNEVNYLASSYVGDMTSPNFGQPSVALPPRQVQLGFRASF